MTVNGCCWPTTVSTVRSVSGFGCFLKPFALMTRDKGYKDEIYVLLKGGDEETFNARSIIRLRLKHSQARPCSYAGRLVTLEAKSSSISFGE